MTTTLDYLLIGHIAHDRTPDGPRLGGTVAYAAAAARVLGMRVGIVTSAAPDDPVLPALGDIPVHLVPASSSTIFVNTYDAQGNRQQRLEGHAAQLNLADIPPDWRVTPIVHLGPVAHELGPTLTPDAFPAALVGLTPQGCMRDWDDSGHVFPAPWRDAAAMLPRAVTILSDEDLGRSRTREHDYAAQAACLVVTRGYDGATLYHDGQEQHFPAPQIAALRHPTGAGDTFAAAFFAMLHRHPANYAYAARTAVIIASTYVEADLSEGVAAPEAMRQVLASPRVQAALNAP